MNVQEQEKDWLAEHARNLASTPSGWATFQNRVHDWMLATFRIEAACDVRERCHRFLEEALELVQSLECTASEAHQLVDYVFGRSGGDQSPELGGAMVCLAALPHVAADSDAQQDDDDIDRPTVVINESAHGMEL